VILRAPLMLQVRSRSCRWLSVVTAGESTCWRGGVTWPRGVVPCCRPAACSRTAASSWGPRMGGLPDDRDREGKAASESDFFRAGGPGHQAKVVNAGQQLQPDREIFPWGRPFPPLLPVRSTSPWVLGIRPGLRVIDGHLTMGMPGGVSVADGSPSLNPVKPQWSALGGQLQELPRGGLNSARRCCCAARPSRPVRPPRYLAEAVGARRRREQPRAGRGESRLEGLTSPCAR